MVGVEHRMNLNRSRAEGIALILLGLVLWVLISPQVIGLNGETAGFTSFFDWLGVSITMFGIVLFFIGVGAIVNA